MAQDLASEFVEDLYRRERSGLTRSVARIAGESSAEDMVHDAFVAYLTKSPWATKPGAWVATVARNRALNELRRPKQVPLTGVESAPSDAATPEAEREAIRSVVAAALSQIDERSLVALRMKFFEGADYPKIAESLGVRVAQAHVIVHRALRRLGRELINRMADAHGASGCAPALVRMAGLGGGDDAHADAPCPVCRPAWDEIVALRVGGWLPAPLIAFRGRVRGWIDAIAGRFAERGPLAAESASRAATAFVALGVAAASVAPSSAAAGPGAVSAPRNAAKPAVVARQVQAPAQVAKPKTDVAPQEPAATRAKAKPAANERAGTVKVGPGRAKPPTTTENGEAGHDSVGGVMVCPDVTRPCEPPPPEETER